MSSLAYYFKTHTHTHTHTHIYIYITLPTGRVLLLLDKSGVFNGNKQTKMDKKKKINDDKKDNFTPKFLFLA